MEELKEHGNEAFKQSQFKKAVQYYTQAIETLGEDFEKLTTSNEIKLAEQLKANPCLQKCFNNRSQCYLKLGSFQKALQDADRVLLAVPNDTKALFRRSQALKELGRLDEALLDAHKLIAIDPKNRDAIELIQCLTRLVQDKRNEQQSTKSQVAKMLELTTNEKGETKSTALNNLIVLSREDAGCELIIASGGIKTLLDMLNKDPKDTDTILSVTRVFASLCKNSFKRLFIYGGGDKAKEVFNQIQQETIASLISHANEEVSTAAALIVQNIIYSVTDLENKRKTVKKAFNEIFEFTPEVQEYIDAIFRSIVMLIMEPSCSGYGRDNCIDLCLKFVDRRCGCGWTTRFVVFGIPKLLRVAATVPELKLKNSLPLTPHTKMHVACCLSTLYDDLYSDSEREKYNDVVNSFVVDLVKEEDMMCKVRAIACLGVVLQGPFEVGSSIIMKNNLINLMLELADSDDVVQEKIAVEAVVFSASKKDKAMGILSEGVDILKKLYNSKNQGIKVRALVGLCKLASCKGSDASVKLLADGSSSKLEKACRKILCSNEDYDSKKWACDGLAYLTLDADVKEILADDTPALKSLYDLAKSDDKNTLFSIASVLANLSNALPVKKPTEEIKKLAEYAKHHIPEENEKDQEAFYKARRQKLIDSGVGSALVLMAKHNSDNCKELIASIFLVLCEEFENRGKIVAAGGGKALIPLALEGTEVGRSRASQALAKIAISINPELAFPGQRCLEVVRPMIRLLHPEKSAVENYEALMALTNLAGVNDDVRKRIVKEQGISNIEQYMFEEHEDLRRAGTECMCNMAQNEDVLFVYEKPDNDRIKLLVLYCAEEDMKLNMAASGALAQFTEMSEKICQRVTEVSSFVSIFKQAACSSHVDFQFRIFYILQNMALKSKDLCTFIVQSELMDVIVALTRIDVEKEREKVKSLANEIVKEALELGLIKPTTVGLSGVVEEGEESD